MTRWRPDGPVRWSRSDGLIDKNGRQLLVILPTNCSKRFIDECGKALVEAINRTQATEGVKP